MNKSPELYKYILDLDGTLYQFDRGEGQTFTKSRFYQNLRRNVYVFFMQRRDITLEEAMIEYERIKTKYNGEVSLGVEREYGIDRYEYFAYTWDFQPELYVERDDDIRETLEQLRGRIALLTAAPRIWAIRTLAFLSLEDLFEGRIFTGEPDLRKPNPEAFRTVVRTLMSSPDLTFSIGDQEETDIVPAKTIGMKTLFIGSTKTSANYRAKDIKSAINLLRREGFV